MKLYYSPGACSLSPHIVLREVGMRFEMEQVDLASHKTKSGADFTQVNPKGYVPALRLDDGQVLTEGVAIVQFIADLHPEAGLVPTPATLARARLQEHLNFIASEFHKAFAPFFAADASEAAQTAAAATIGHRLDYFENIFADGRPYLLGDTFSVADAYLFVISTWTKPTGIGLDKWPHVADFVKRVARREKVREAMHAEGILLPPEKGPKDGGGGRQATAREPSS